MVVKPTSRDARSAKQVTRKAIPLQKAHIHDTAVEADTNFLVPDITPSDAPCLFRIQIQVDTAAVFSAMVTNAAGGAGEMTLKFNSGAQLTAGVLNIFDMLVDVGDEVNFQVDQNVNIDKFIVQEV
ncbi:unnamed protein product, partial [marine sediment metagenome]